MIRFFFVFLSEIWDVTFAGQMPLLPKDGELGEGEGYYFFNFLGSTSSW